MQKRVGPAAEDFQDSSWTGSTTTKPAWCTRSARPGRKRTRTWRKPSISLSFMPAALRRLSGLAAADARPGEKNHLRYLPLGVGIVIPPWNFPLAILVGMTVAAIVTGNTVVLKPSSDAPPIAYKFFEALEEAGMPPGVVNFLPCSGAAVGDVLVGHPRTRFVAFTGSKKSDCTSMSWRPRPHRDKSG